MSAVFDSAIVAAGQAKKEYSGRDPLLSERAGRLQARLRDRPSDHRCLTELMQVL
jgi:hypothetical protein